jgi:hypothetical protein
LRVHAEAHRRAYGQRWRRSCCRLEPAAAAGAANSCPVVAELSGLVDPVTVLCRVVRRRSPRSPRSWRTRPRSLPAPRSIGRARCRPRTGDRRRGRLTGGARPGLGCTRSRRGRRSGRVGRLGAGGARPIRRRRGRHWRAIRRRCWISSLLADLTLATETEAELRDATTAAPRGYARGRSLGRRRRGSCRRSGDGAA